MMGLMAFTGCNTEPDPVTPPTVTKPDKTKPATEYFFNVVELQSGMTGMPRFSGLELKKKRLEPVLIDSEMVCAGNSCSWKYKYSQDSAFSIDWRVDSVQAWSGLSISYFSKSNLTARIKAEIIARDPVTMATLPPVAITSLTGDTLVEPGHDKHLMFGYLSKPGMDYMIKLTGAADSGKSVFSYSERIQNRTMNGPLSLEAIDTLFKAMLGNWNWIGTSGSCRQSDPHYGSWASEGEESMKLIVSEDSTILITKHASRKSEDTVNIGPPLNRKSGYLPINKSLFQPLEVGFPHTYWSGEYYVSKNVLVFRHWYSHGCGAELLFSKEGEIEPLIN